MSANKRLLASGDVLEVHFRDSRGYEWGTVGEEQLVLLPTGDVVECLVSARCVNRLAFRDAIEPTPPMSKAKEPQKSVYQVARESLLIERAILSNIKKVFCRSYDYLNNVFNFEHTISELKQDIDEIDKKINANAKQCEESDSDILSSQLAEATQVCRTCSLKDWSAKVYGKTIVDSAIEAAKRFKEPGEWRVTGEGVDTIVNVVCEISWKAIDLRKECKDQGET